MILNHLPLPAHSLRGATKVLLVAVCATAAACGDSAKSPSEPKTPVGIAGRITSVVPTGSFRGTIRVEENPLAPSGGNKALVTVTGATTILLLSRAEGEFRQLRSGQWVRVWFNGPVAESYPVQGTAATIVIDSAGTTVMNRVPR
ncbi:MAG: DUF3221 domain-containing protein [Gemmatimonadaceae bacterium]|nr:DUF3221 domain-containing protein [Gemmatimonadaceae bacterium]